MKIRIAFGVTLFLLLIAALPLIAIQPLFAPTVNVAADCVWVCPTPALPTSTPQPAGVNWRKGVVSVGPGDSFDLDLARFGAGWFYNYWYSGDEGRHRGWVPEVHTGFVTAGVLETVNSIPKGSYWLVFNEPDRWDGDNSAPVYAAQEYYRLRSVVLPIDPTAKFIVGGVSTVGYTTGFAWMKTMAAEYLRLYGEVLPSAGWHVHHYYCGTGYDKLKWRNQLSDFNRWMGGIGLGGREFWVTEYGCLSQDAWAATVMKDQIAWMNSGAVVTRHSWFATRNNTGAGDLLNWDGTLTPLGVVYTRGY
jgi:hypothetical protein